MSDLKVTSDVPTEIKMTRTFDAPRRLVIQALTKPELLKRWLGNSHSAVASVEMDARVGGTYRYVYRKPDGGEFAFTGVIRELGEDRIVHTEMMEGMPVEALVTTTLAEQGGKTVMTVIMSFPTREIRDAVLQTGMEHGAAESYDNMNRLVASL